jgi:hypothetical protein
VIDAEALLTEYLKPIADQLDAVVVGEAPEDTAQAFVKLTQIDARNQGNPDVDRFTRFQVQLDCYASENGPVGQSEAAALYRAMRAALVELPEEGGEVTAVRFGSAIRMPDNDFKPARQRFIFDAHVYAH